MIEEFELEDLIMAFDTDEDEEGTAAADLTDDETEDAEGLEDEEETPKVLADEEEEL